MNIIHSCLRDAAPDAWGRRLIQYQYASLNANELDYMLLSGSNRIGALDFQNTSYEFVPRESNEVDLEKLLMVTEYIEKNQPLPEELAYVLLHGTSVGGARPKALIHDNKTQYIAKFSSTTDTFNVIKSEYVAMRLARYVEIDVPAVHLKNIHKKDILLVERFDRTEKKGDKNQQSCRKLMLSGLSILGLNEMEARYASYRDFADIIRQNFSAPKASLVEMYKRLIFNVLIGNTDDHARNHAAFWDGQHLSLTPAYDLCPQYRVGFEATQAMAIDGDEGNFSTLTNVLSVCDAFLLDSHQARRLIEHMINTIEQYWDSCCMEASMTEQEKKTLWKKSILNPYCLKDF